MRRISSILACTALVFTSSCESFLETEKAISDPNNPSVANINQLFVGVQANIFGQQEGAVAMTSCIWMQQCAGVNGRFVQTYGLYGVVPTSHDADFASIYTAGGLVGIRQVQERATAAGDLKYRGVAKVLEAMNMMFAADVWGDVPYSEAVAAETEPAFDEQAAVYSALLTLLDEAITDLAGAGAGPGDFDLIYAGDMTKWTKAAHMLKARIHLHRVEGELGGVAGFGTGNLASARTEATAGFTAAADDFLTLHTSATSERNMWAQFQNTAFGTDLVAGSTLVNIMNAQADPRRPEYFGLNNNGAFGGFDVSTGGTPVDDISPIAGSERTDDATFRQPVMTFEERQLILAETEFRLAATPAAGAIAAAPLLNGVRALHGKTAIPAASVTLNDIMTEKYILLFGNIEAWNDWKRTCLPARSPAINNPRIPGRLYYGDTEEQTNGNTPPSTSQNLTGAPATARNDNDPAACS
jgi:hypothetical protein